MRTVFLGTSAFAAALLTRLVGERGQPDSYAPALVLTRPDRPAGRGRKLGAPPVAETARALGLALAQPESVNEPAVRELIADIAPDAVIVCAFGALVKEPLLSDYEMLNVHPSLLPRWRGAAPIERAIMAGDERTGVSIMRLTAGLDSGPVCLLASEPIHADDTFGSLAGRLERVGGDLLLSALWTLDRGEPLAFAEQDEGQITYAEKIVAADRLLDPKRPAVELERVVRALSPHVGTRVALSDGTQLGVRRAALGTPPASDGGEGVHARDGRLLLDCVEGALELIEVQPPGKRPMPAEAFLRGHGLKSP
ncbi:MAG TPA: methionyl-tRNA formyltransferase [Solirubrobacteraceae bacterium]|jgi:methionyl-tRNA formyltransferase|nr:methionyl-tRNA formyltransferase [Solirubrobacteraceae bacterium]